MVGFWETPSELGREVSFALSDVKKRQPAKGWVRAADVEQVRLKSVAKFIAKSAHPTKEETHSSNQNDLRFLTIILLAAIFSFLILNLDFHLLQTGFAHADYCLPD